MLTPREKLNQTLWNNRQEDCLLMQFQWTLLRCWCRGAQLCAPTRKADALTLVSDSMPNLSFASALK
jgi:hypothetical protein